MSPSLRAVLVALTAYRKEGDVQPRIGRNAVLTRVIPTPVAFHITISESPWQDCPFHAASML